MFTWICPKCGGEVPPSYTDCPKCTPKIAAPIPDLQAQAPPAAASTPPPDTTPAAPVPAVPVAPAAPAAAPYHPLFSPTAPTPHPPMPATEPTRRGVSPVLVAICAAAGLVVVLGILYLYVLPDRSQATNTQAPPLQNAAAVGSAPSAHPLAKHLEVAGIRVGETAPQTAKISFVVINHSAADLPELKMQVMLRPTTGGNPVFDFAVDLPSIGPYESREMTSKVKTTLKPYEIPDWQMLRPEFRLTSEP